MAVEGVQFSRLPPSGRPLTSWIASVATMVPWAKLDSSNGEFHPLSLPGRPGRRGAGKRAGVQGSDNASFTYDCGVNVARTTLRRRVVERLAEESGRSLRRNPGTRDSASLPRINRSTLSAIEIEVNLQEDQFLFDKQLYDDDSNLAATEAPYCLLSNKQEVWPQSRRRSGSAEAPLSEIERLRQLLRTFSEHHDTPEGCLPLRQVLREAGRQDIVRAIERLGGFRSAADKLGLTSARRKRGYWEDFGNLRAELIQLQKQHSLPHNTMPTRAFMEAQGRYDLARALEKWGGLQNVAKVLGLTVVRTRKKPVRKMNDPYSAFLGSKANERAHVKIVHDTDVINDVKGGSRGAEEEKRPLPMKADLPGKSKKWFSMPS